MRTLTGDRDLHRVSSTFRDGRRGAGADVVVGKGGFCMGDGAGGARSAGQIDGPGEVLENYGLKAEAMRVERAETYAEVIGQTDEEEAREFAFPEVAREAGAGVLVVLYESGVAVDVFAEAFAEQELRVRDVESGGNGGTGGALDAVVRPEVLNAVWDFYRVRERVFAVGAGEADVVDGVPVRGEEDMVELAGEGVDAGDDAVALLYRKWATGEEVGLHVNDEEGVGGPESQHNEGNLSVWQRRLS